MHYIPWLCLILQGAIVAASLLGYGIFTSRPELLIELDPGAHFFTWAFYGFAVGNMLFGGVAVVAEAVLHDRTRALWAFALIYFASLVGELLGTTYGIPFGAYSYTALLGIKWFDRVPLLIPLSWFTMSWACWVIARQRRAGLSAVLFGTALLVAWDLLLDPAMSKVTSYWIWGEMGSYYGMPWMNLLGWCVTGLVLFIMLSKIAPSPHSEVRFAISVYIINFALPLGFCVLNQYWLAVWAALGAIAIAFFLFGRKATILPARELTDLHPSGRAEGLSSQRE
jgi:uncharacterized membrane protein